VVFDCSKAEAFPRPMYHMSQIEGTYIFSNRNIAVPIATLKESSARALWGTEGNRAGTAAVQAIACTDKSDKTLTWLDGSLRVAVNRLAVSTSEHTCLF
jgi:hypothetical protein